MRNRLDNFKSMKLKNKEGNKRRLKKSTKNNQLQI